MRSTVASTTPVGVGALERVADLDAGHGAVDVVERREAALEDVPGEQRPGAVVDGDDGRRRRHLEQAGAHRVGALAAALGDQQRLGVVEGQQLAGEAHRVRRVQHDDEAGDLAAWPAAGAPSG